MDCIEESAAEIGFLTYRAKHHITFNVTRMCMGGEVGGGG